MNNDTKASFLKDEYLLLQRIYEDFDQRAMTIKGWSATIAVAAIGAENTIPLVICCGRFISLLDVRGSLEELSIFICTTNYKD